MTPVAAQAVRSSPKPSAASSAHSQATYWAGQPVEIERRDQPREVLEHVTVRLVPGQGQRDQRGGGRQGGEPVRIIDQPGGMRPQQLDLEGPEMLGKPPAPAHGDQVPRLQQRAPFRRLPAAHQPGAPAMRLGQQLDDRRALAMPPRGQHKPGIAPVHQLVPALHEDRVSFETHSTTRNP